MKEQLQNPSVYRDLTAPVIVCHHTREDAFISIPHLHAQYEIYYNIQGGQSFFIDKVFYQCEPHSVFLIPKTQVHKVVVEKNCPYERCIININAEIIESLAKLPNMAADQMDWLKLAGRGYPQKATLHESAHRAFVSMIDDYLRLPEQTGQLRRLIVLLELLELLREQFALQKDAPAPVCEPVTLSDKVIRYIERDPAQPFTIKEIAQALFVHENYLCTRFKAETDMTVNHYIILRKLAEAKKVLYRGGTVKEACFTSGFQNYSNFIRTFKSKEGYPPSQLKSLTTPL